MIDPSGRWLGETDGGLGSPTIRYQGCGGSDGVSGLNTVVAIAREYPLSPAMPFVQI